MDCIIQVTQWQKSESLLEEWINFLEKKGFSLKIKRKKNGEGHIMYGLFRSITEEEKQEIKDKKYTIVNGAFERRVENGRRVR